MAIVVTSIGAGACGSTNTTPVPTTRPAPAPRPHPHRSAPALPAIGVTQVVHASDTTLSVSVSQVIDPLVNSGAALVGGTRAVGVLVHIHNQGPGTYDSSATGDISMTMSSGAAMPAFAARGQCQTPLRDFDNAISPGESRAGCVTFAVPASARILAVRFSPHGQAGGSVRWRGGR